MADNMKKMYILTFLVMLIGGCSYDSGRIRLFNYNFWGKAILYIAFPSVIMSRCAR